MEAGMNVLIVNNVTGEGPGTIEDHLRKVGELESDGKKRRQKKALTCKASDDKLL
jgi:hypothetical protein